MECRFFLPKHTICTIFTSQTNNKGFVGSHYIHCVLLLGPISWVGGLKKYKRPMKRDDGRALSTKNKKKEKKKIRRRVSLSTHTQHTTHTLHSRDLHYFIPLVRCCLPSARRYLPHPGRRRVKRSGRSAATMGEVARGPWACTHRRRTTSEETISGSFY